MKTQALKGMRDLLPAEQTLRDYIQGKILETYRASGFERISTPMLEDMENLDKSDGGDNLNLIFKVLKRGDKLTAALNTGDPKQLSDMGLRYDLTLPLSRYYAANKDKLPSPFKVIQLDDQMMIKKEDYFKENGGIVIPNPNAPTGILMPLSEIEDIIAHNRDVIVVVDEAYIDFGGESALPLIEKYDNLLVVQTFSKSRSLAGMRLGFAMGFKISKGVMI